MALQSYGSLPKNVLRFSPTYQLLVHSQIQTANAVGLNE